MSAASRLCSVLLAMACLLMGAQACRPVVTVSWTEVALIAGVIILLLLPLLLRILRLMAPAEPSRRGAERNDEDGGD